MSLKNLSNRLFFKKKRSKDTLYKIRVGDENVKVKVKNVKQFEDDIR